MNLTLTDDQVVMIINALDYYAQQEAGQTQAPDLCEPSDFPEHSLASSLDRRLSTSQKLRAQWVLDERTGERTKRTT